MANPTMAHLKMAKHVLRYLRGTLDYNLRFRRPMIPLELSGFSDADWGGSEDRHSITGYGFQLSNNGPLVSWKSRKQQSVALSTCESEYMALAAATQEARFLRQLFRDMRGPQDQEGVVIYVDNQSAMALAKTPVQHQRSKHIDIKYHFVRTEVQKGTVQLKYIQSENNVADVFTKPVSGVRLNKFSKLRGI